MFFSGATSAEKLLLFSDDAETLTNDPESLEANPPAFDINIFGSSPVAGHIPGAWAGVRTAV